MPHFLFGDLPDFALPLVGEFRKHRHPPNYLVVPSKQKAKWRGECYPPEISRTRVCPIGGLPINRAAGQLCTRVIHVQSHQVNALEEASHRGTDFVNHAVGLAYRALQLVRTVKAVSLIFEIYLVQTVWTQDRPACQISIDGSPKLKTEKPLSGLQSQLTGWDMIMSLSSDYAPLRSAA